MLSILGFLPSCDHTGAKYGPPPDIVKHNIYDTIHARFIIKGTVLSEKENKVIPNIKVNQGTDSVFTDINGKFQIETMSFPNDNMQDITLQDIDGKANGEFQSLDVQVDFKDVPFSGGDGNLNKGEAVKEIDIMLKPK